MRKNRFAGMVCLLLAAMSMYAGITTYTFTNKNWGSKVGAEVCDGTTDGWTCDKAGYEYLTGRPDAQGRWYSQGVSVKTGETNDAGATSVIAFTNVRQLTLNFCQNSSKGKGVFYYQVGSAPYDSLIINTWR